MSHTLALQTSLSQVLRLGGCLDGVRLTGFSMFALQNGLSWDEWQDSAEERAIKAEEERQAMEKQRAKDEAIKAQQAAENMDKENAKRRVAGGRGGG